MKTYYKIIFTTFLLIGFNACEKEDEHIHNNNEITGCTDVEASNYDPNANENDGSCEYEGCTNPDAINYNSESTIDDGSCIILGCTDEEATNYNPLATNDDGSCEYSVSAILNGNWNITLLNYDTDVDLSFLEDLIDIPFPLGTQQITGQAQNAGYFNLNSLSMTYSNEIDFDTEPFTILTFETPSIPFNSTSSGSWVLENNDTDIIFTDQNTGNQDYYEIVNIDDNSLFLNGTVVVSPPIPGFEDTQISVEIDVQIQLEKIN